MKKIISLVIPMIAVSLLASCSSTHKFTFTGEYCKINNSRSYSCDTYKDAQYTVIADNGYTLPETIESDVSYIRTADQAAVITINEIKGDIDVTVKATPTLLTFTVTFDANGGKLTDDTTNPVVVKSNHPVLEKDAPKLKDRPGYDKSKVTWINKETGETFTFGDTGTLVTKNTTVQAKWGAASQFTVNFYNDDGTGYTGLTNLKVDYGDKVLYKNCPLDDTYDEHYTFDGWYNKLPSDPEAELFSFDKPLEGDIDEPINIYAKHAKRKYYVTFNANGGEFTSGGDPLEVTYLGTVDVSRRPTVTRSGYAPTTTWCTDRDGQNVFEFGVTPIESHTTLYAKWGEPVEPRTTYTVTLDAWLGYFVNGKHEMTFEFSKEVTDITLYKIINSVNSIPTLSSNNTFAYYTYANESSIDYDDKVTGNDITLWAHYLPISTPYTDLEKVSWKTIHDVAVTNIKPETCFAIGATKHIEVNGYQHLIKIVGFNHDKLVTSTSEDQQYAGITFEFFNLITEDNQYGYVRTYWEYSFDGNIEYSTCTLRNFLNSGENSIFAKLPKELRDEGMIKEVYKPVAETSSYTINYNYSDKLFPLSCYELTGQSREYAKNEGSQYEYWKTHNTNEDRKKSTTKGAVYPYWLRSPDTHDLGIAWSIDNDGTFTNKISILYFQLAVAPAFCI